MRTRVLYRRCRDEGLDYRPYVVAIKLALLFLFFSVCSLDSDFAISAFIPWSRDLTYWHGLKDVHHFHVLYNVETVVHALKIRRDNLSL